MSLDVLGGHSKLLSGQGTGQPDPTLKLALLRVAVGTGSSWEFLQPKLLRASPLWFSSEGRGWVKVGQGLRSQRQGQMSSFLLLAQKFVYSQLRWKAQGHLGQGHHPGSLKSFLAQITETLRCSYLVFLMFVSLERQIWMGFFLWNIKA